MSRSFAKSNLLAIAVGLAVLGSSLTPAPALPNLNLSNKKMPLPSVPAPKTSAVSLGTIRLPPIAQIDGTQPGKSVGGGIDNICPFNKFKCPPKPPAGPSSTSNPPQAPGSTPPKSGGQTYPSGGAGPVVVLSPPQVVQALPQVVQTPAPVVQFPRPIVTATNAA